MPRKLTAVDVCEVTGYSRSELRSVLNALPYYRDQKSHPRKAREFTRHDLIVLGVVQTLETRHGMRKDAIARVFDALRTALSGPRDQNPHASILVSLLPPAVTYEESPAKVSPGIWVALEPVFNKVDRHFGPYLAPLPEQRDLALSPALIASRTRMKTS